MTTNAELADRFEEFAQYLEAQGVDYKPQSYRRAAENLRSHPRSVADLAREGQDAVEEIDGVGDAIASKIVEYVETGEIEELEELRAELPVDMVALTSVEGVGPKTVGDLYEALEITTLDELEAAAEAGEIREVKGFGAKTEQNILDNIPFARQSQERELLGDARPVADELLAYLRGDDAVDSAEVAGSIRRWRDTIGDVDVLVGSDDSESVVSSFTDWSNADGVIEAGESKASLRSNGIRVDLRVVVPEEFGSALQYFTGSRDHNIQLRNVAIERGLKINEYGIFDISGVDDPDAGQRVGERIGGESEAEIYDALDLPVIPPELREDNGEIQAAQIGALPDLLEEGEILGDLHTHTDWSDGANSVEEMVAAAAERGYEYHCVTDHATGPGMVGGVGLSDDELRDQMDEIEAVRADADIEVFHGVEANIDAEGSISVDDDLLAELDIVVASPHSALGQGREEATDRLVAAVEHPSVDVLGHPTGRLINQRAGLDLDFDRLAAAAAEHGTALEINANPARLDLWGEVVMVGVDAGATIAVDTDAHSPGEFENVRYGVHTARRGWAETTDVLNARDAAGLREFLH
ncbi:DNA polymerase/3'-5' exonuclease PolX [Haloprofundus sp. MHR1]|uniref:DNA polymerase/3'-5' exonuclease PolX n=1 Tax=Haloprofundus sp. MHR1 TaxID=2572921 RepID=UPI0010BEB9EB|nr:DNA polymerase/3'-5' exonuclease PolX [Haloprofundus sp. MHR1]QCJ47576.1 DNA polymerase/3'-5' exonuclease PolX [Haloprofundus sp. MHR1]